MAAHFWTTRRRRIALIAAIPILLVFIIWLFLNAILAPIIGRKIQAAVIKGSDSLYRVSFSDIHINVFTGNAALEDIRLTADTHRTAEQVATGSAKQLRITGAGLLAYLFHKKIEIDQISLTRPELSYRMYKSSNNKVQGSLYQKILPIKLIALGRINLDHARLELCDYTGAKPNIQHLKDLDLEAIDLRIDSVAERDTTRTLFCRDILVGMKNFHGSVEGGIYQYGFRRARFSTRSGKLFVTKLFLTPLPVKAFFARTNTDRFECAVDSITLEHFNYRSLMRDRFLVVNKVSMFRGTISVFGNPNGKLNRSDRVHTFPHEVIRRLPVHFTVDTLDASGFAVHYRELNHKDGKTGELQFTNTSVRFLNISNQPERLKIQPICKAQLTSLFMGRGKLKLAIDFNLVDKVYAYNYQGRLGTMPLEAVNPLAMPLGLVRIKSGELKALDFSIRADQRKGTGTLHLLYDELSVDVLNPDYSTKVLKTLAVKAFVVRKSNPDNAGTPARFAKVVFLRPKSYPFFKTLWETIFSGLKPCAGIGYAVKPDPDKPLTKKEQKAKKKALKKAAKAKKKADKEFRKKLKHQ